MSASAVEVFTCENCDEEVVVTEANFETEAPIGNMLCSECSDAELDYIVSTDKS